MYQCVSVPLIKLTAMDKSPCAYTRNLSNFLSIKDHMCHTRLYLALWGDRRYSPGLFPTLPRKTMEKLFGNILHRGDRACLPLLAHLLRLKRMGTIGNYGDMLLSYSDESNYFYTSKLSGKRRIRTRRFLSFFFIATSSRVASTEKQVPNHGEIQR